MINLQNELGCYQYDGEFFVNKYQAVDRAREKHDPLPYISLWFHDDLFSKLNWQEEPDLSLDALYKLQAETLRNKHDYLILMYSGGSDSHQVLRTFMKNNIHIDEIRSYWPIQLANKITPTFDPKDPKGLLSEYHSVMPWFKRIKNELPRTILNVVDYSDHITEYLTDDFLSQYETKIRHHAHIYTQIKHAFESNDLIKHISTLPAKNVGVIYGSDKPKFFIKDNLFCFRFLDLGRPGADIAQQTNINYTPHMFYWSPSAPFIPIKQCHIIKKFIEQTPELHKIAIDYAHVLRENALLKRVMYPDFDPTIYQKVGKPVGGDDIIEYFFKEKHVHDFVKEKNLYMENKYQELKRIQTRKSEALKHYLSYTDSRVYTIGNINLV